MDSVFVGIDVACAKRKRLPIVVCKRAGSALAPLFLRDRTLPAPPSGMGNALTIDSTAVARFAADTVAYLRGVEQHFELEIARIAIDAPSAPKQEGVYRRQAELALDRIGVSCFTTPDSTTFEKISDRVRGHLAAGGTHSTIPHANQLWMLVGFALFRELGRIWQCIEVFPHAIAHALGEASAKKSLAEGLARQITAVSRRAGWPAAEGSSALRRLGYGSLHDTLDAYLAAWVASLPDDELEPLGIPPNDVIWVPRRLS